MKISGVIDPVPNERVIAEKENLDLTQNRSTAGSIRSSLDIQSYLKVKWWLGVLGQGL